MDRPPRTEPPRPSTRLDAVRAGAVAIAPILVGVVPFGLIAGVAATEIGLGLGEASGFSVLVFAGASQLAAIDLIGRDAAIPVAVATILVINLRMLMYSASLAPHVAHEPLHRRAAMAYTVTDQAYAVAIIRYEAGDDPRHRLAFWFGASLPMWASWQAATIVGALAGSTIPDGVPLSFAIPLTFLALLRPAVRDRPTLTAAVSAATVAVVAAPLPWNLGLPLAAVAGIVTGVVATDHATAARS